MLLCVGPCVVPLATAQEAAAPPEFFWNDLESKRVKFLARAIRQADDGYWTHTKAGFEVSTSISARIAAEGVCYAEDMLRAFPRTLGLSLPSRAAQFRLVFHKTREQFAQATGGDYAGGALHKVTTGERGAFLAEVHLAADLPTGGSIDSCFDLRTLHYETARALLRVCAAGRRLPWFVREGCAGYFETCDVRASNPERESWIARSRHGSFVQPLKAAIFDDTEFRPELYRLIHQSEGTFSSEDEALHRALATGFVAHLMATTRLRPALRGMIAKAAQQPATDDAPPPTLVDRKTAAALETGWYRYLCGIVARSAPVQQFEIQVDGTPARAPSHTKLSAYGNKPFVSVIPGAKGAFDIAWYDTSARSVRILQCDAPARKTGEVAPAFIQEAGSLLGAARRPRDRSYVVGYSRDNTHGDKAFEFWLARFDDTGKQIFNTRIFGDKSSQDLWSKGGPGGAGTARIAFNDKSDIFGFYLSHNMKWKDGVRHQGGYIGFIRPNGKQLFHSGDKHVGNGWFFSHNFDQRLIVANGSYYALAHGDAYPRALGFSKWTDAGGGKANLVNARYHDVPGKSGDNTTHCQTGGVVPLKGKTFAVLFATSNDRPSHDVCLKILSDSGSVEREEWVTSYGDDRYAAFPRIARYGQGVLIAWEEVTSGSHQSTLQIKVLDASAKGLAGPYPVPDAHVPPCCDIVGLDDGAVVWASPAGGSHIRVYRIDSPQVMEERLVKRLTSRPARPTPTGRTPKPGTIDAIDKKVITKLAGLDGGSAFFKTPVRLSAAKPPVRFVAADSAGQLTVRPTTGARHAETRLAYGELPLRERAALVLALAKQEPANKTLYGVAGFYLDCAGDGATAEKCYQRAGSEAADTFAALFEPE
jgi:hypothetical protein